MQRSYRIPHPGTRRGPFVGVRLPRVHEAVHLEGRPQDPQVEAPPRERARRPNRRTVHTVRKDLRVQASKESRHATSSQFRGLGNKNYPCVHVKSYFGY